MDFDGGFASLPFRSLEEEEEAAASVGRGPDPRAPPEEGAARRAGTVRGGAALPARCSHGHRPAAPGPRREAVCALLGTRGQPVRSRCGSDFLGRSTKGDVLFFENNWSHWQEAATLHRRREPLPADQTMLLN